MMLWLFCEHHVLPGYYYRLPEGEKVILRAMFSYICEERKNL